MNSTKIYFLVEIDFTIEDLTTNSNASNNLKKQEGNYTDFYFNYGLDVDTRNSTYNPSKGNRFSFYQKLPVSSDQKKFQILLLLLNTNH